MKFPVTRLELQGYDTQEKVNSQRIIHELEKRLNAIVKNICEEFERSFYTNFAEKKYVYKHIQMAIMVPAIANMGGQGSTVKLTEDDALTMLIDKLKEVFVDCTFTVDPLKTYLVISWD
jgi:hypothetical protein